MTNALSTLRDTVYGRVWSFPYNCYEVGHGWTPFCTDAACDVGFAAFKNALPLYTSLYLATQLGIQRKYSPGAFLETFKSICTSSAFLAYNFFAGIGVSCLLRNNSDRYYYRTQCLLPGFIAGYMALLIERPARRAALSFYMANMSSELLYKLAVSRGVAPTLPHGETVIFVAGMACFQHFIRQHGFGRDPVSLALKYLMGPYEAKRFARGQRQIESSGCKQAAQADDHAASIEQQKSSHTTDDDASHTQQVTAHTQGNTKKRPYFTKLARLEESWTALLNVFFGAHPACPHPGVSCADYCITPTLTRFLWGYLGRSMLNLAGSFHLLRRAPGQAFKQAFTAKSSINLGLFLGTFVGAARLVNCVLRRASDKQEVWHSAVAGGVAGFSMLFAPRSTLATYIFWKCLEQYFFLGVNRGVIKHENQIICLVYALSINVLLYIFALEPRFIRPSYMKFIDKISNHKLHQVNRMVLDVFGTGASVGYEDWFPDLDPKHMTREFQELVFNWLIQPY